MSIKRFRFKNLKNNLQIEEIHFDDFNLLVGVSGAGKTSILQFLKSACAAATNQSSNLQNCEWEMTVETEKGEYFWLAKTFGTEKVEKGFFFQWSDEESSKSRAHFVQEEVWFEGQLIVRRKDEGITFEEKELPKLKDTESCISLFSVESSIKPLYDALKLVQMSEAAGENDVTFLGKTPEITFQSIDELRKNRSFSLIQKAFLLQESFPKLFKKVEEQYKEIFPTVTKIRVDVIAKLVDNIFFSDVSQTLAQTFLTIAFQEEGIEGWIDLPSMSSGMQRTLLHLFELLLQPSGSVLIVDEYENSLGVNCLPALTEYLIDRAEELQFILTSHHPYVIRNIPINYWRVVTRSGSTIKVKNASQIKGLTSKSSQDAFIRLINSPAFEEGLS